MKAFVRKEVSDQSFLNSEKKFSNYCFPPRTFRRIVKSNRVQIISSRTICDVLTHSCKNISDISVNLYLARTGVFVHCQIAGKRENSSNILPLPKRNYRSTIVDYNHDIVEV